MFRNNPGELGMARRKLLGHLNSLTYCFANPDPENRIRSKHLNLHFHYRVTVCGVTAFETFLELSACEVVQIGKDREKKDDADENDRKDPLDELTEISRLEKR